jgi:hypothetical protein
MNRAANQAQLQLLIQQANDAANNAQLQIAAANAATAAMNAAAANVPQAQPVIIAPFALHEGNAFMPPINWANPNDVKFYNRAIKGSDVKFDLSSAKLNQFMVKLKIRASTCGWANVTEVPDDQGILRDITVSYGMLTIDNCRNHANTYVLAETRQAQNSHMLFTYVLDTLDEQAEGLMLADPQQYTVQGQSAGILLLKLVIGKATVDTKATVIMIRRSLTHLDSKMIELGSDINTFNLFVTQQVNALTARGQLEFPDLLIHLMDGYLAASDRPFVRYISRKQEDYDSGKDLFTSEQLMNDAANYFKVKMQQNAWSTADSKKDRILALSAEVDSPQMQLIALQAELEATKLKLKKRSKFASSDDRWRKLPPINDELVKTVKGKSYNWCHKHAAWVRHSPSECTLPDKSDKPIPPTNPNNNKLVMSNAYKAYITQENAGSDSD